MPGYGNSEGYGIVLHSDIVTLRGSFKNKGGIFGCREYRTLTFDNDYLLGNIHSYSIAAHVNMAHARHVF